MSHKGIAEEREKLTEDQRRMVEENLGLVYAIVNAMHGRERLRVDRDDAIQAGSIGLMRAAQLYRPDLGWAFSTYASYHIKAFIQRLAFGEAGIRVPAHVRTMMAAQEGSVAAAQAKTRRGAAQLASGLKAIGVQSMGEHIAPSKAPDVADELADRDEAASLWVAVAGALDDLPPREREVVASRWMGEEKETLKSIGRRLGLTRERARQLEIVALRRLREHSALAPYAMGA
jgi:RNA polymerase sigma factor (sigma-70 family)